MSGSGRQVRGDGVVWKSVEDHVAAVRELARQVRARSPKQVSSIHLELIYISSVLILLYI